MAFYKENYVPVDIDDLNVRRNFRNLTVGEGDDTADRFGVDVYENGEPVQLTGCICTGYFMRSDGITLIIMGSVDGNRAYVDLPEAAYAKEGNFCLAIKVSGTGFSATMRIVDGTVMTTTTDKIEDQEGTIPDIDELLAVISQAEDAADEIAGYAVTATLIEGTRYGIAFTVPS